MLELMFPRRQGKRERKRPQRVCPGHRAWVRRHHCSVPGCLKIPVECAHVRSQTDAGIALKPSDCWVISLCVFHHHEQHQIGEQAFEVRHAIDMRELAQEFARRSPFRSKLTQS